jgi:hypothetical protein
VCRPNSLFEIINPPDRPISGPKPQGDLELAPFTSACAVLAPVSKALKILQIKVLREALQRDDQDRPLARRCYRLGAEMAISRVNAVEGAELLLPASKVACCRPPPIRVWQGTTLARVRARGMTKLPGRGPAHDRQIGPIGKGVAVKEEHVRP